ncbi:MAG: adenylate/guanylate cyclase domain-containing protein [Deltaproteobacteria bacterium]|nr:adenylate/guanylate cyclase domain-containing protein [Deltaproteobacteria bacterium]
MRKRLDAILDLLRTRGGISLGIGLLVFLGVMGARELGWLMSWELGAFDGYLRLRPVLASEPPVAMVWVREQEITQYGHPLPDRVLVDALERILGQGPSAVGIDIYRDRPSGEGWDDLRDLFLSDPRIVVVEKLADAEHPNVPPPPFLPDRRQVGFADIARTADGVTRRGLLMLWDEKGQAFVSFSLQLALRHLYADGLTMTADPENPEFVRIGATALPPFQPDFGGYKRADDGGYQYVMDYRRANGSYPSASLSEVLAGEVDPALFRGRVVVVGTDSPSVKDDIQTPLGFLPGEDPLIRGAEFHAHAIDQLTRYARGEDSPITSFTEPQEALWILAWCLLGAVVAIRVSSPLSLVVTLMLELAVLLGVCYLAFLATWWIPVVPAAVGSLGASGLVVAYIIQQERADRLKAMNLFGRFVSRSVVERIWEDRELFMEGDRPRPQRITVTVMLTDLTGYTTASEKKEPAEVMDWIGTYMDRMAYLVEKHGGMVNDFLGDGLMANFGVPVASTTEQEMNRDAINAVECALEMGESLDELNENWRREGAPTGRMRIGILTGPGVVGALGSKDRMKYATVGNTVNTASRLESFDKASFGSEAERSTCRILIGHATFERLGGRFVTKGLGEHMLKGKGEPIRIHRVLARARDTQPAAGGSGEGSGS